VGSVSGSGLVEWWQTSTVGLIAEGERVLLLCEGHSCNGENGDGERERRGELKDELQRGERSNKQDKQAKKI